MKKKLLLPIVLILALLCACSPEIVNTLHYENVKQDSSSLEVRKSEKGITVQFNLTPYANSYAYKIDDSPLTLITTKQYLGNGNYCFDIDTEQISGSIVIYGNAASNASVNDVDSWIQIAQNDFAVSLSGMDIKNQVYVAKRGENYVDIGINSTINPNLVFYLVDGEYTPQIDKHLIRVETPNAGATTLTIQQGLFSSPNLESMSGECTLDVYPYNSSTFSNMQLSIDNEFLTVTNIENGVKEITFAKVNDPNTNENIATMPVVNGKAQFEIKKLPSLYNGYFFAHANGKVSNYVKYTTPIKVNSTIINWKSVDLEIELDPNIDNLKLEVLGGGAAAKAEKISQSIIRISGLDSNTHYSNLKLRAPEYPSYTAYNMDITTKSFAGTFEWKGTLKKGKNTKNTNFKIDVIEAPKHSTVGYNVYFNDEDSAIIENNCIGEKLRIMPLVDASADNVPMLGENDRVVMANPGIYEKQNKGYTVNSKKWNSINISPDSWTIKAFEATKDYAKTVTISDSVAKNLPTNTIFSFEEKEINGVIMPVVMFENSSTNFFVKTGLFTNGSINSALGEGTYTFCLQKCNL